MEALSCDSNKTIGFPASYGINVFGDQEMRQRISKETFESLKKTIDSGVPLDITLASEVAVAMKQWAVERGATHYTHWFMPMTGMTAEKHDSFIEATSDGRVIIDFSGKALIKGEPDASSFPNGGLRETAAARGYTAWDCTSPAFIRDKTLCIPTAFFSRTGEILDKKAPLLRSLEAISVQGLRILKLLGDHKTKKIVVNLGPEQEYFLVNKKYYDLRLDLLTTGRTLFGARPPKGQELEDQYFGAIKPNVQEFMNELNYTLWELGISAKTEHNEVAPSQHELAVIFDPCNIAADRNQLVMETMKRVAKKHGMVCLLHEKPYARVNGSGKHINWSLSTDSDDNILDPGSNPSTNFRFLIFFAAVIKALDEYADLICMSVASASNDHRLGGGEAPPAIMSMFVGEELQGVIDAYEKGEFYKPLEIETTNLGVASMSVCTVDTADRNRTSPFAFTGNRFEFRMCGSSNNIACPCYTLNTVVAYVLKEIGDKLEKADDIEKEIQIIFKDIIKKHKRIIFNGNNYSEEWPIEAKKRGLYVIENSVSAFRSFLDKKNIAMFEAMGVLTKREAESRYDITTHYYSLTIAVEARTAVDMINRQIIPAVVESIKHTSDSIASAEKVGLDMAETRIAAQRQVELLNALHVKVRELDAASQVAENIKDITEQALNYSSTICTMLSDIREVVDALEEMVSADCWPIPTYTELMFKY